MASNVKLSSLMKVNRSRSFSGPTRYTERPAAGPGAVASWQAVSGRSSPPSASRGNSLVR